MSKKLPVSRKNLDCNLIPAQDRGAITPPTQDPSRMRRTLWLSHHDPRVVTGKRDARLPPPFRPGANRKSHRVPSSTETHSREAPGKPSHRVTQSSRAGPSRSQQEPTAYSGFHLNPFTVLVTYIRSRAIPASARALLSTSPAGPTKGLPAISS